MAEQKEVVTEIAELVPEMLDRMPGDTKIQKLAYFLANVGLAAGGYTTGNGGQAGREQLRG